MKIKVLQATHDGKTAVGIKPLKPIEQQRRENLIPSGSTETKLFWIEPPENVKVFWDVEGNLKGDILAHAASDPLANLVGRFESEVEFSETEIEI